jgi:hypothetical protein
MRWCALYWFLPELLFQILCLVWRFSFGLSGCFCAFHYRRKISPLCLMTCLYSSYKTLVHSWYSLWGQWKDYYPPSVARIGKLLSSKQNPNQNQFEKSGVYQLTCPDRNMKYVEQTGRPIRVRFQEHFRNYKYANNKSKLAQHLVDNNHSTSPIESIMNVRVLYTTNKGRLLDTTERFYIYNETRKSNQINDKNTAKPKVIFETIIREETSTANNTA